MVQSFALCVLWRKAYAVHFHSLALSYSLSKSILISLILIFIKFTDLLSHGYGRHKVNVQNIDMFCGALQFSQS